MHIVKVVNKSKFDLPVCESEGASGMDLRANFETTEHARHIDPYASVLIPTGIYIEIPIGYEAQVRTRSGLALKYGLVVLNSPGTIDADYRGEVGVIIHNTGGAPQMIKDGDRIAQLVFAKVEHIEWQEVTQLGVTERGGNGFGSTGKS